MGMESTVEAEAAELKDELLLPLCPPIIPIFPENPVAGRLLPALLVLMAVGPAGFLSIESNSADESFCPDGEVAFVGVIDIGASIKKTDVISATVHLTLRNFLLLLADMAKTALVLTIDGLFSRGDAPDF